MSRKNDMDKEELRAINQVAVTLNLVTQEEADLCTKMGKSLAYRIKLRENGIIKKFSL